MIVFLNLTRNDGYITMKNNQEPALELDSRAAPRVEAHHHVNGPDTGRNSVERRIKKTLIVQDLLKTGFLRARNPKKVYYSLSGDAIYSKSH